MQQRPDFLMGKALEDRQTEHLPVLLRKAVNQRHQIIIGRNRILHFVRHILNIQILGLADKVLAFLKIIQRHILHDDAHPRFQPLRVPEFAY